MKNDIVALFQKVSKTTDFLPSNINLHDYILKIIQNSTIICQYTEGQLIGLVSYYDNDNTKVSSFLSMIIVDPNSHKKKIGSNLLEASIRDLKLKGFLNYYLEVKKNNYKAIRLYEKYGFEFVHTKKDFNKMRLILQ